MSKKAQSNILLVITSIIWGASFVAQKAGTALEPFTYNGVRTTLACLFLVPIIWLFDRGKTPAEKTVSGDPALDRKNLLTGGILCGIILFVALNLQQFGIYFDTDAGKAGFITTLYILIVPVLGIFLHKKVSLKMWTCVIVGAAGFYCLTMAGKGDGFTLEKGDFFVLLCAFVFSIHILAIDYFSPKCDGVKLSCLQFFFGGALCLIAMVIFEDPKLPEILACWLPIAYSGIASSGIGYTLQILAQKNADPTTASLIMSLESVFAVIAGVIIYHEQLTFIELLGCVIIFAAVIVSQLPSKNSEA